MPASRPPPRRSPEPSNSAGRSAEIETLDQSIAALQGHVAAERVRVGELEAVLPALDADEQAEADAARAQSAARADLEARAAVLASRRRELEVRHAGLHERQHLLEHRISETERRLEADHDARMVAGQRRLDLERALGAVERLAAIVEM